jgi:hypothetical protein
MPAQVDPRVREDDKILKLRFLFNVIQRLFSLRRYLEEFIQAIAGIFIAPGAVLHAFFLRAVPYLAHAAITDVPAFSSAAIAVDIFCFEGMVVFFTPLFCHYLPQFVIIVLRCFVSITVRAD